MLTISSRKVSIIIVSYNRAADLKACLDSIRRQTCTDYEVLVMDNGSQDRTEEVVRDCRIADCVCYKASKNLGTSYARNVGVCLARGRYIWFLDSDSELLKDDCLEQYIDYFEKDPEAGVIGGEAVLNASHVVVGVKTQRLRPNGFLRGEHLDLGVVQKTDVITTCNFFTTKEIFLAVGGFDLTYFYPYIDDVDISYRIFKMGQKLEILGTGGVLHKYSHAARHDGESLGEALTRLYLVLKEFPTKNVILLPLLDLQMIFRFENFDRVKRLLFLSSYGKKATVIRLEPQNAALGFSGTFMVVRRLLRFIFSMVLSYFVIIPRIPGILRKRNRHCNHLDGLDLKVYRRAVSSTRG